MVTIGAKHKKDISGTWWKLTLQRSCGFRGAQPSQSCGNQKGLACRRVTRSGLLLPSHLSLADPNWKQAKDPGRQTLGPGLQEAQAEQRWRASWEEPTVTASSKLLLLCLAPLSGWTILILLPHKL